MLQQTHPTPNISESQQTDSDHRYYEAAQSHFRFQARDVDLSRSSLGTSTKKRR
jgi:primosomal protein N''